MTGCIVGWAHSKFGKLDGQDVEALIVEAATDAMADAGVGPDDIDAIYLGLFNNGFSGQDFPSSLVLQADDNFASSQRRGRECLCDYGSDPSGLNYLEAKQGKVVLVVGVEKMTETAGPEIGILMKASYLKRIRN